MIEWKRHECGVKNISRLVNCFCYSLHCFYTLVHMNSKLSLNIHSILFLILHWYDIHLWSHHQIKNLLEDILKLLISCYLFACSLNYFLWRKNTINLLHTICYNLFTFVTFPSRFTTVLTFTRYQGTSLLFTITACFTAVVSIISPRTC